MSENNKIEKKSHKKSLTIIAIIVAFIIGGASVAAYNNYTYQKKVEAAKKAIDEKKKELDTSVKKMLDQIKNVTDKIKPLTKSLGEYQEMVKKIWKGDFKNQPYRKALVEAGVDIIAIGNGTASRETESFVANVIKEASKPVSYLIVSEAGASVYSASKIAIEEFPDLDVTARGAISIARRIQDPMAELVKIDPKSIGVGMYQHDVNQKKLNETLEQTIEHVVNNVGVNINTASWALLSFVSGIKKNVAKNLVDYRHENGDFKDRKELKKVKGLGTKAFEQMAGFVVVPNSKNPLDNTIIHPESYHIAETILKEANCKVDDLKSDLDEVRQKLKTVNLDKIIKENDFGPQTAKDVYEALLKDRRDPRDEFEKPLLRSDILNMDDLQEGMVLEGTVRNVAKFGAFVDIGLKSDALIHVSEISDKFVADPTKELSVGQIIKVKILSLDKVRGRVGLSNFHPQQKGRSLNGKWAIDVALF